MQGTVVFVTVARATGDTFWMQIPDGWVRQWHRGVTCLDTYSPEKYPSSVEGRTAVIHPTSLHRPQIIRTYPPNTENVRTAHMQRLLAMQQNIERLNRNLEAMQMSLQELQGDLSQSIAGTTIECYSLPFNVVLEEISFLVQEDAINSTPPPSNSSRQDRPAETEAAPSPPTTEIKVPSHSMTLRRRGDAKQQEEREKRIPAAFRDASPSASREAPNEQKHE